MNLFEMVFAIVVVSMIAGTVSSWLKHKQKNNVSPVDDNRLNRLEERVRVLERIVTDPGYEVRRQFRDLERDA